jgi:hypothetical protein
MHDLSLNLYLQCFLLRNSLLSCEFLKLGTSRRSWHLLLLKIHPRFLSCTFSSFRHVADLTWLLPCQSYHEMHRHHLSFRIFSHIPIFCLPDFSQVTFLENTPMPSHLLGERLTPSYGLGVSLWPDPCLFCLISVLRDPRLSSAPWTWASAKQSWCGPLGERSMAATLKTAPTQKAATFMRQFPERSTESLPLELCVLLNHTFIYLREFKRMVGTVVWISVLKRTC